MRITIRIHEALYQAAKKVARAERRTVSNQIEFWVKIGKCGLENPDLPINFLQEVLISKNQDYCLAKPFSFEDNNNE